MESNYSKLYWRVSIGNEVILKLKAETLSKYWHKKHKRWLNKAKHKLDCTVRCVICISINHQTSYYLNQILPVAAFNKTFILISWPMLSNQMNEKQHRIRVNAIEDNLISLHKINLFNKRRTTTRRMRVRVREPKAYVMSWCLSFS